jgi:pimeloyl-ACP methyl ester carboxylesterase
MGGLITILEASQHPESVTAVVLIDPALPVKVGSQPDALVSASFGMYAVPHLGRAMLRARRRVRTPEQLAMDILRLCCVDPTLVPAEVREQLLEVARERSAYPDIDAHFLGAARSLVRMLVRRSSYEAAMAAIRVPVLLLHGEKDRLVTVGASRAAAAANPSWHLDVAPDVGHVPMLEVPEWTAGRILGWLATDVSGQRRTGGADTHGTETQDADTRGTDTHGTETHGTETRGTETQDADTRGTDTQDIDRERGATRGTAERT